MSNTFSVCRSIWTDPQFPNEPFTKREAWLWIVSEAAWKERTVRIGASVVKLKRGQLAVAVRGLAQIWGWKKTKVERFLEALTQEKNIGTDTETGVTRITVCNYEKFQHAPKGNRTPSGTAAGQQRDSSGTILNKDEIPEEIPVISPLSPPDGEPPAKTGKGSRLPDDWTPSDKNIQDAQACGLTADEVCHEADKFRDYWISKPGAGGRKSDWDATWRNWCRKSRENKPRSGYQQPKHPLAQAFDELRSDIRRAENRVEPVPSGQAEHDGGTVIELTAVGGRDHRRGEAHGGGCPDDGDNPLRLFPSERFR